MPAHACAGNDTARLGGTMEIERRNRRRSQPEAAQRIALLLFRLWHDRRAVAQPFTRWTGVIALVIVRCLVCRVSNIAVIIVMVHRGNGPVAQFRVHNARVDDAAAQAKQPDQQYVDCESAKTLGLGEHGSIIAKWRVRPFQEGYFSLVRLG